MGFGAVVVSEWTKIRSVRSTVWTLLVTLIVSVGLSALFGLLLRHEFGSMSVAQRRTFDPVQAGFYSLTLGQLSLVVFGVLLVSTEYTSGTIGISLVAVPLRGLFYAGKVLAGSVVALASSVVIVAATFVTAQWALGPHGASLGEISALRATAGACLYMTLMCVFTMGVAAMLRSTALSLGIMIPLLFLGSQGLGNVPKVGKVAQYLPDQAGYVMMQTVRVSSSSNFHRDYGPLGGLEILVAWTAAALFFGCFLLCRRDA